MRAAVLRMAPVLLALAGCTSFEASENAAPDAGHRDGGAPAAGERYGACYPNATCNPGLQCRDGLCLRPEDPTPVGDGGAASADAGPDAAARSSIVPSVVCACGPTGTDDCCRGSVPVPKGSYNRSSSADYPATVGDFRLDVYEVTVGRFRAFVGGYPANKPVPSSGRNLANGADPGWDPAWNTNGALPGDKAALIAGLQCSPSFETWTNTAGGNESRAMNCITWYEAFAFCIWDGGRLPTEAEWNYAAAGGAEQRVYPWSSPAASTTIDDTYAMYGAGATAAVGKVGAKPKGAARWGHADMGGNLWEWVVDFSSAFYSMTTCTNCANFDVATTRVARGGSFNDTAVRLDAAYRGFGVPGSRYNVNGVRCARAL